MKDLLNQDKKVFSIAENEFVVAQVNCVNLGEIASRTEEVEKEILHEIAKYGYALFLFVVTDIVHSHSIVFAYGKLEHLVEDAFQQNLEDHQMILENVVSRKKQILPLLMLSAQNL